MFLTVSYNEFHKICSALTDVKYDIRQQELKSASAQFQIFGQNRPRMWMNTVHERFSEHRYCQADAYRLILSDQAIYMHNTVSHVVDSTYIMCYVSNISFSASASSYRHHTG